MKQTLLFSLFLGCLLLSARPAGAAERPIAFVSIPPQAWLVERLAGESVDVQILLTGGANPHTFEPAARQIKKLTEAALFFTIGMPFEATMATRAGRLNPALKVAAMDAGIAKRGAPAHDHDHAERGHVCGTGGDPHIWLSPRLMCAMASNTVAALEQALPQQHDTLRANLEKCVAEIQAVDLAVREKTRGLRGRTWVVYHPSWGYFADDYGLALLVIEQDGKSPSVRHLAEVIGQAKASGARAVFAEPQYDKRPAQTLAEQIGARLYVVDPLQEDWPALMRTMASNLAEP